MSDVDEMDFTESQQQDSNSFRYSTEPLGTPPSVPKSPTIPPPQENLERKHRRSVSEQLFTVPSLHNITARGYIRGRHRKRNTADRNGDEDGERDTDVGSLGVRYGGGSLIGYNTGWDYGDRSVPGAYLSDFSPFERSGENSNHHHLSTGRSLGGTHFKQALKRTVKKALNSPRADAECIAESSLNGSPIMVHDSRHHYKKLSGERKLYQRRSSFCDDQLGRKTRSDSGSNSTSSDSIVVDSDGQVVDSQRKQSRIRHSLADLFSRVKRSIPGSPLGGDAKQICWDCTLALRSAKLKEKVNCCVHVLYMDKFVVKSSFSGETSTPRWNETFTFPINNLDGTLELQVIEKHTVRSDKLIGRAYIALRRDENVCSHEAMIKYFSIRKGSSQTLGTLRVDTSIEPSLLTSLDGYSLFGTAEDSEPLDESASATTASSSHRKPLLRKKLARKLASHIHHHRFHRSKSRQPKQSSIETFYEPSIRNDSTFYFSPYEVTRRYLENEASVSSPNVTWRPFFDWPGHRCLEPPMVAIQRRHPARFWELRIPKLPWPIEFLLPMTRLAFPTANLVDTLDVGDTVKVTKIVESGVINLYLVGARGLRSMPQVEMTPGCGMDEKGSGGGGSGVGGGSVMGGSVAVGTPIGGGEGQVMQVGASGSNVIAASPETRAASIVALHWAAKSFTLPPSPQVEFSYGNEKKSSNVVKNNSNPDFLEEFEFQLTNGSPGYIRVTVYDRETQPGSGGIPRSSILGEIVIDLTDMPLELTQKMELQLLKNSNEARILMFVTITGLSTAARSPLQTRDRSSSYLNSASPLATSRSVLSLSNFDQGRETRESPGEREEKSIYPNLPINYLQIVAEHFSAKNSLKNLQDIGWMRLKICSAMGLGGKTTNARSEIFCTVDVVNTHLRTQNVIKRKNPTWNRCFVIPLSDIHGIMKLTVIEVEKSKAEVIGGLAIHPLRVDNEGSKWYALKTPDLRSPTKGSILLEINVCFNQFKSALKSFSPMEVRYRSFAKNQKEIHRHELRLLQQRFEHVKPLLDLIRWCGRVLDDWWLWKNPIHSIFGLIGYQLVIYYFQPYFIPLYMIMVLLKNRIYNCEDVDTIIHGLKHNKNAAQLASPQEHEIYKHQYEILEQYMSQGSSNPARTWGRSQGDEGNDLDLFDYSALGNESDPNKAYLGGIQNNDEVEALTLYSLALPELPNEQVREDEEKVTVSTKAEGKKTMRTRYTGIKETITRIFDIVEKTASFYERVEGLFNWRIPWVSSLAVIVLLITTVILYFIPVKYLFMAWGLNKFTKAILRPNALRNNEIMDFLSRVPNLIEAIELTEYRPDAFTLTPKGKTHKS
ncbi:multiple C2 and transmembrane domain containing protein [Echinococcus multilocularis]|uniref:Multiple C2 and transmembrane domain containing protein n=1 Tax=Echinococcus multilocularis TaxID=6211 RepID=A0A068YJE3_ECHMU|nr:multiple C2 and transmembrane domain containing protein [Echinococcus multilocularis]